MTVMAIQCQLNRVKMPVSAHPYLGVRIGTEDVLDQTARRVENDPCFGHRNTPSDVKADFWHNQLGRTLVTFRVRWGPLYLEGQVP